MQRELTGKVIRGLGGLFEMALYDPDVGENVRVSCRAKGALHRADEKILIGDNVRILIDDAAKDSIVVSSVLERKNCLIRPPMANLDELYAVFSPTHPVPVLETVDKLLAVALTGGIRPSVVITKQDLDGEEAERLRELYRQAGFPVFVTCAATGAGIEELKEDVYSRLVGGRCAAFSGVSGVGKTTLMNALFPGLSLSVGGLSEKIERGKNTTRHVELFPLSDAADTGYLADTPGFSLLDFEHFDFFDLSKIPLAFPDVFSFADGCRYADCAHDREGREECAVLRAAEDGRLAPSRLASYRSVYRTLKAKKNYGK